MQVVIVGAGLAGLSAAGTLSDAGCAVTVIDKGRGPGGRCATRRSEVGRFDHGAPYLHNLTEEFVAGHAGLLRKAGTGWLPVPDVSALPKEIGKPLTIRQAERVTSIIPEAGSWMTTIDGNGESRLMADCVLVCIPAPQAPDILPRGMFPEIRRVRMSPEWTLLCGFEQKSGGPSSLDLPDGHWALRQNDLEGRAGGGDRWVVRASADWSAALIDEDKGKVANLMLTALQAETDLGAPVHLNLHRWLYARTARPLGEPCLWDGPTRIGCAGDWCIGPYAGDAIASGQALAERVLVDRL